ncbi:TIGR02808 family protein [Oceanisphaera sp. W20_SRM_FM3]
MDILKDVFWELLGDLAMPTLFVLGFISLALVSCVLLFWLEKKR